MPRFLRSLALLTLLVALPSARAGDTAPPEAPPTDAPVVVLTLDSVPPDGVFRFFPGWRPNAAPRWGLALGGGGAWGFAHLGLLEALDDEGLAPDLLAGTSIGALIGGLAATGLSPYDIEDALRRTDWNLVLTRNPRPRGLTLPHDPLGQQRALISTGRQRDGRRLVYRGIIPDGRLNVELVRYLAYAGTAAGNEFDRLAIPFRAVATDLVSGTRYVPAAGSLPGIVRASIGLPVFRPVVAGGRVLVDGGALENVPARTAREMGAEFVLAAQLTTGDENLPPPEAMSSLTALIGRTYDVSFNDQRRGVLESADAVLNLAVGNLPFLDFSGHVSETIEAGRTSWRAHRERILSALEARARDKRTFEVHSIEPGPDVEPVMTGEMAVRLGIDKGPRTVSALRLEIELLRLVRRGAYESGEIEVHPDGRVVVKLGRGTVVRSLTLDIPDALRSEMAGVSLERLPAPVIPATVMRAIDSALIRARQRGLFLCGVARLDWDRDAGALHIAFDQGRFASVETRSTTTGPDAPSPLRIAGARGKTARIETMEEIYSELLQRGDLSEASGIEIVRQPDGLFAASLLVDEPPMWEFALQPGFSDALGPTIWTRFSFPSLRGWRHWDLDLRLAAWRLGTLFGFEVGPPRSPLFMRFTVSRSLVPAYNAGGDLVGSRPFWAEAGSVGVRTSQGALGRAEALLVLRGANDTAFVEEPGTGSGRPLDEKRADPSNDFSFEVTWSGDRRDDPSRPASGLSWSLTGIAPLAISRRAALVAADVSLHVPLASRRLTASLLLRAADAQRGRPLPVDRWTDVGAWKEAPRMLPERGLSPTVRRATLLVRHELGSFSGTAIGVGVSAAVWQLGELRSDPGLPRNGHGFSVFADAFYGRFGPVTAGIAWGSLRGNAFFVLASPVRAPWPGPRIQMPGR